jgi:predicted permease
VLPPDFWYGEPVDVWTPLRPSPRGEGGGENYAILARLRPGVSWGEADGELASIGEPLMRDMYRIPTRTVRLSVIPLQRGLTEEFRLPLLILLAAVAIVLVIGCVNIAGLLLARGATRAPEIATRMALGAARGVIVRHLLIESIALAACGGAVSVGITIGYALLQVLGYYMADVLGRQPFTLDLRVLAITAGVSLCTSIVFGLLPAFRASRVDLRAAMTESGGTAVAGAASGWPRRMLVVAEVALGVALLVGAGLLVRTLAYLTAQKPGFDGTNVMTASLSLQDARYASTDQINRLFDDTLDCIRTMPGVETAAVCLTLPYERALNMPWRFIGGAGPSSQMSVINVTYVTADYFRAFGIAAVRGRVFTTADTTTAAKAVVVNQAFVQRYSRDEDPLGREIAFGNTAWTVVGVVGDILQRANFGNFGPVAPIPAAYIPASQVSNAMFSTVHTWFSPSWIVRTARGSAEAGAEMQRALHAFDPQMPFAKFRNVSDVRDEAVVEQRAETILLGSLAALAIALAAVGLYGLMASSVSERTRELGIRMALGANARQAVIAAAAPGIGLGVLGIALGLLAARLGSTVMGHLVWGVSTSDPLTFAAAATTVLVVAAVATFIPALRIVRLNPLKALRSS